MTKLERLYTYQRQSPWLDNLTRPYLRDGTLAAFVAAGIRGVTANPTILAKAIGASDLYDAQFFALTAAGCSVEDAYWELAVDDVTDALAALRRLMRITFKNNAFRGVAYLDGDASHRGEKPPVDTTRRRSVW